LPANADAPPIDVNAVNTLAAQRASIQRQRDNIRAQIHLQLNMLDQFSRDIQRMRREVTDSLNVIDNEINQANLNINNINNRYNDIIRNDNLINRNDIIHLNYDQR
jgi:chromosome segregation ATPase